MINKFCKFCKEHKDISCFGKDKLRVDGLSFYCKNCNSEYVSMKDDEFKKCWALDNLRPLSAKENLLKRDKVIL